MTSLRARFEKWCGVGAAKLLTFTHKDGTVLTVTVQSESRTHTDALAAAIKAQFDPTPAPADQSASSAPPIFETIDHMIDNLYTMKKNHPWK